MCPRFLDGIHWTKARHIDWASVGVHLESLYGIPPSVCCSCMQSRSACCCSSAVRCCCIPLSAVVPCCCPRRDLWQRSWLAALKCTPLQDLAAERAAMADVAWEAGGYQDGVTHSALCQALMSAGSALKAAATVWVGRVLRKACVTGKCCFLCCPCL